MRPRLRDFALAVTMLGCAALVSGGASATPTLVGTTTNPTGINGLVVDGTTYNVTFSTTTLNSFTPGTTLSTDAAAALADALNSLSVTALDQQPVSLFVIDVDNSLTNFDDANYCLPQCSGKLSTQWISSTFGSASLGYNLGGLFGGNDFYVEAADFSAVSTSGVPEPLTLSLFGAGLIGGVAMRRKKRVA